MAETLTKQDILDLFKKQAEEFDLRLRKEALEREKERQEREKELEKKREAERKNAAREFDIRLREEAQERKISQKEFDKKIGEITGTLGKFVEGLVEPKLLNLFRERGIELEEIHRNVEIKRKGRLETEIDLLLVNTNYSVAVEVKTTLTVAAVNHHLERLDKLCEYPPRTIRDTKLIGAVAGMRIEEEADKYAYRKGLFVLKQKGEIVELSNDETFKPREWDVTK